MPLLFFLFAVAVVGHCESRVVGLWQSRNSDVVRLSFCVERSGSAESLYAVFLFVVAVAVVGHCESRVVGSWQSRNSNVVVVSWLVILRERAESLNVFFLFAVAVVCHCESRVVGSWQSRNSDVFVVLETATPHPNTLPQGAREYTTTANRKNAPMDSAHAASLMQNDRFGFLFRKGRGNDGIKNKK
jgi:hypothetical protein